MPDAAGRPARRVTGRQIGTLAGCRSTSAAPGRSSPSSSSRLRPPDQPQPTGPRPAAYLAAAGVSRCCCSCPCSCTRRPTPWSPRRFGLPGRPRSWPTSGAATRPTTRPRAGRARARWSPWSGRLANGAIAVAGWLLADHVPGGVPPCWSARSSDQRLRRAVQPPARACPWTAALVDALVWRVTGSREIGLIVAGWCGRAVTVLVRAWALLLPFVRGLPALAVHRRLGRRHRRLPVGRGHHAIRTGRARDALSAIPIGSVWRRASSLPGRQQRRGRLGAARQRARRHRGGRASPATARRRAWSTTDALSGIPEDGRTRHPGHGRGPPAARRVGRRRRPRRPGHRRGRDHADAAGQRRPRAARPGRVEGIVLADDLEAALSRGASART